MYMCRLRVDGDAESGVEGADGICQRGRRLTGTCPVRHGSSLSPQQEFLEIPVSSSCYQIVAVNQIIMFLMAKKKRRKSIVMYQRQIITEIYYSYPLF